MIVVDHVFKSVAAAGGSLEILHGIDFSLCRQHHSHCGRLWLREKYFAVRHGWAGRWTCPTVDLFALDEDARAAVRGRKMGFVFQNFQLLSNLTALENVMLPLELSGCSDARPRAQNMLEQVGLGATFAALSEGPFRWRTAACSPGARFCGVARAPLGR